MIRVVVVSALNTTMGATKNNKFPTKVAIVKEYLRQETKRAKQVWPLGTEEAFTLLTQQPRV